MEKSTKKNLLITAIIFSGCFLQACENFEDKPLERATEEYVWNESDINGTYARNWVTGIYSKLPRGYNNYSGVPLECLTDDAVPSESTNSLWNIIRGGYNPSSTFNYNWETCYEMIRRANVFLANYQRIPWANQNEPVYLEAEVRALRAFYYFEMVKGYGGVPLVGDVILEPVSSELSTLGRNSFEECISYIVSELDAVENSLRPEASLSERASKANGTADGTDPYAGRIRKRIVQALKAKVLLYAASPLFNPSSHPDKSYTGYSDYNRDRWKAAADAAKEIIDSGEFDLEEDRYTLNMTSINKEVIWMRMGFGKTDQYGYVMSPLGMVVSNTATRGLVSPTQELVDAFPMKDGRTVEEAELDGSYNDQNPYANRDPRLGQTIFYHGARWLNQTLNMEVGETNYPTTGSYSTRVLSGYYAKKFLGNDDNRSTFSQTNYNNVYPSSWMLIRYADILLMYAEAMNEYEDNAAVREELIQQSLIPIRRRAGIDAGDNGRYGLPESLSQADLRQIIRNERRVELAFEESRFWDIRRWKIAKEVYNTPLHGVRIENKQFSSVEIATPYFTDAMYLLPIRLNEVKANPNIAQNPEY